MRPICLLELGFAVLLMIFFDVAEAGTIKLPSFPLAVRSPYLSTWLPGNVASNAPTAQPQFWAGQPLTWSVLAQVDGTTYTLFGAPKGVTNTKVATQSSISYTSTHTKINLVAGTAAITLDFFSPVSPKNFLRQSLPYSYLTISVTKSGTTAPSVQILSAIDDSWTAQQGHISPTYQTAGTTQLFDFYNAANVLYVEKSDMALWGSVLFGTQPSASSILTHQSGSAATVYSGFVSSGKLANTVATYTTGNLVAFAHGLGTISSTSSVTYAVGHDRAHAINFLGASQSGYYRATHPNAPAAMDYFLGDYAAANAESTAFDQAILANASAISTNYSDIVEASVRQTYGAMEITIPYDTLSTSNPQIFVKEISSDGNINTVDVVYPTSPLLYYLSPEYIKLLLQPVLTYLASGAWPHPYVVHDLGTHYPNATGHNDGNAENIIVQATGSLIIMVYAYQRISGNTTWLVPYKSLLQGYADYLANNGLYPAIQRSSVDAIPASANQTALAICAAVGLNAFGKLSGQTNYSTKAADFATSLYTNGLGTDAAKTHFTYNYNASTSWGTPFDLYADKFLELNTFPAAALSMQSSWYAKQITSAGMPFAGSVNFAITDWEMFAAATSSAAVQKAFVASEHAFLTNGLNAVPFPTKYTLTGAQAGEYIVNHARSTVGSNFALLTVGATAL